MNNNVYIRSHKSIYTISITRMLLLLPLIIYGLYKNGVYLYINHYITLFSMFRGFILVLGSILIGSFVNIIYEMIIKKRKDSFKNILFSSFHIEYALVCSMVMPYNVNLVCYFSVLFVILFISKFLKDRINVISLMVIIIYLISNYLSKIDFKSIYESTKVFSLDFLDYFIGRGVGGLLSTSVILIFIALIILHLTNNNKTTISIISLITFTIACIIYSLVKHVNLCEMLYAPNIIFALAFISTDSCTSPYTKNGMCLFGGLLGIMTFGLYLLVPMYAPFIAILVLSLFNNLIDRKTN